MAPIIRNLVLDLGQGAGLIAGHNFTNHGTIYLRLLGSLLPSHKSRDPSPRQPVSSPGFDPVSTGSSFSGQLDVLISLTLSANINAPQLWCLIITIDLPAYNHSYLPLWSIFQPYFTSLNLMVEFSHPTA